MSFAELLEEALARGDADAAATLVIERLGPEIHRYLRALLRDAEEADDVFSTWAENVWKGLPSWRREGTARAWAYRVAWNAASHARRDPYRRRKVRLESTQASRLAMSVAASERRSQERQANELDELRASLTVEEQSLLTLKNDRELSWREIAEIMAEEGTPVDEAALRKRYERLKAKLARLAEAKGLLKKP